MSVEKARYKLWGRRIFPDQTEIDTYIDFIRFWFSLDKKFIAIGFGGENYRTDVHRNILTRFFVFEKFLPPHIWADPNKKFSSLLESLSDKYKDMIQDDDFFKKAVDEIDGIEDIDQFQEIAKWMASLNVSRSLDISVRAKGRERWWAQYFPPFDEEMLSHEIWIDELPGKKNGSQRQPFSKISNPKYNFQARSGEVLYWLMSILPDKDKNELSEVLKGFYSGNNPYSVIFNLFHHFVNFYFYETLEEGNITVRKDVAKLIDTENREDFIKLLIDIQNGNQEKSGDHSFPSNFSDAEKIIYSRWFCGLKNIFRSANSRDVAVSRASKYLVWTNIKYLIVRANKCVLEFKGENFNEEMLSPEMLVSFPGVDGLQALVQKSRVCFNEIHRLIEAAHHLEVQKIVKEKDGDVNVDLERKGFNSEHGAYMTRRGKKLGVIHPPNSGGRHFFSINEAFLDVLVAANFSSETGDIVEFSEFLELLRKNEGLIFDLDSLKNGHSLKDLVKEETSGFDLNVRILKDKFRNLGILQEASDSNAYVLKPSKSGSDEKGILNNE